jgi:hypothetical protein
MSNCSDRIGTFLMYGCSRYVYSAGLNKEDALGSGGTGSPWQSHLFSAGCFILRYVQFHRIFQHILENLSSE